MTAESTVIEKALDAHDNYTSIRVSRKTLDLLGRLGHFKDTWETIIQSLASEKLGLEINREERSF